MISYACTRCTEDTYVHVVIVFPARIRVRWWSLTYEYLEFIKLESYQDHDWITIG